MTGIGEFNSEVRRLIWLGWVVLSGTLVRDSINNT